MPLAAQDLFEMEKGKLEAVVCFGILMKGETAHFEMVLNTMTAARKKVTKTNIHNKLIGVEIVDTPIEAEMLEMKKKVLQKTDIGF